jgi:hypothetical protein
MFQSYSHGPVALVGTHGKENCSLYGSQEAERVTGRVRVQYPLKGMPPMP